MSDALHEFENELEFEAEGEFESEFEAEFENEAEAFGWADAKNWASNEWTALTTPGSTERRVLLGAAKTAAPLVGTGVGTAIGGRFGNPGLGGTIGGGIGSWAAGLLPDKESEFEFEAEFESEFEGEGEFEFEGEGEFESFANPTGRVYPDALAEHMGLAAMESESELEAAEHFAPLIPVVASKVLPMAARLAPKLGARALPHVARVINHATPHLTRGVTHLARVIHRDPRTRPLLRVIPSVAQRTVTRIARHAAAGRPVSPQHAVRMLRHENHRVLSNPRVLHGVLRHARRMDRHAGQATGLPLHAGHPHHRHYRHWRYHPGHPKYLAYLRWRRMRGLPTTYGATAPAPTSWGGTSWGGPGWTGTGGALPPRFGGPATGTGTRVSVCPTCGQAAARRICTC